MHYCICRRICHILLPHISRCLFDWEGGKGLGTRWSLPANRKHGGPHGRYSGHLYDETYIATFNWRISYMYDGL